MPSTGILDTYTAKAAYALRRLSSAYAGKCLRVRRSSDNTEQDIDFDGSGIIDWSAATTFASGGNLFVAKWYDQSGNSLDLVQATSGNQPQLDLTNHKISFTASSSQNLVCSTDFSSTNKFSAYSLFERNSSTGGYEGFWGYGSSGTDFTELMYNLDLAGKAFFDYGGSAIYVSESTFSNNTFYTHSSIIDRSASPKLHHFRNGTEQTSITGTGATGNFPNGSLYIGSRQGNSGYSNCSFKEFIVFLGTAHGSTARSAVESDIDGGLGVTLPDSTPPSDVTGLTGTVPSATEVDLNWDDATDTDSAISDYTVYRNTSNTHSGQTTSAVGSNTSAKNITGLTPGEDYYFWIKAKNGGGLLSDNYSSVLQKSTPPRIDTESLDSAVINVPFSQIVAKTSAQAGTFSLPEGAPAGVDIDETTGEITFTGTETGITDDFVVRFTVTSSGLYAEATYSITVVPAIIVPTSMWSRMGLFSLKDSLFWNALDNAEDATEIGDYSGNDNKLAVASSAPALQSNVINGKPGIYFDGTNNPLKFTKDLTLKHLFLIAKFDGAAFTGNEGLFSGVASGSILRGNGSGQTKFENLSIGSGYTYKKNYITLTEATENAPMNAFAIIELIFPSGKALDGVQIGQDTTHTDRKFKGWFVEQIGYGEVQDDCATKAIYEYFALKFWLWRYKSDNYPYFPFVFNRSSKHRSTELAEISEAEGLRGSDRVVRYLDDAPLHSYDLEFNYRFYLEYLATVQFLNERRLHLPFWIEDIERTFERRMTRTTELTDNGYGSAYKFDYNFGVKDY